MFLNQPLGWRNPNSTEATNQLAHVESELCWCDPIVEVDEYGRKIVMHKEVTWHGIAAVDMRVGRRRSQMINMSQNGVRYRATRPIRTHEGLIRRFTEGTIQGVIDNLGRQLINVEWDSGITTYAFFNEIEITDGVETSAAFF